MDHQEDVFILEMLVEELKCNREVDFSIKDRQYFIEPSTTHKHPTIYAVWDVKPHLCIFKGDLCDLVEFTFPSGESLKNDFDGFEFQYIY